MAKGYIRPSASPYAAHCLMVPKPGNPKELRLVIDYRMLNKQTVKDKYPLPDIQVMFDEMHGAKFFSSFDAVDGFWQVPMAPGDVEKTAFTTQMGSYEWLVMPQGLQNSPSQYQRRMQRALGHLPFVRIFIDDVVVFSNTLEEHYRHVEQLLLTCREKGVFLKRSKVQLLKKSLRFLGHTMSADGCRPQHDKDNGDGLRVIAYESRQFSTAEQNYHTGERELCALHHCSTVTWRHYLIFTNFRLQGDHRPLEWLMEPGRELSRRQARWYMDLVEVGVPRMEYIKGRGIVDDLPVNPLTSIDSEETLHSTFPSSSPPWVQELDAWLTATDTLQVAEEAMEEAGDLAYTFASRLPTPDPSTLSRLSQNRSAKTSSIPQSQDRPPPDPEPPEPSPVASRTRGRTNPEHTSAAFVLPDLQSRLPAWRKLFRMAGMRIVEVIPTHDNQGATEDVGAWMSSCPTCQAVRPRSSYPDGMLNPRAIPARRWQDVSVDFVTGLPLTDRGNDAFIAFTCKLSKMVHVVPMNFGDSSAATVARIYFDSVWRLHGAPMKIISDRDPRFHDAFWQELMRLMGVKVARTTPYNPRSDGQAEHTNRVIEDMLRSFVDANVADWDLFATNVEFAINDSRSDATGYTPFELCCGVSPLSQLDLFLEAAKLDGGRRQGGVGTAHEFAAKFSSQLRDARHRMELAQQRQREQFDRRHAQREYAVGDLVWIEAKHLTEKVMDRSLCRKLTKRWHGPVPVVERFFSDTQAELPEADRGAPVAYRLRLPPHWRIHDVFAKHRLKPYVSGQGEFAARDQPAIPEAVVVDGQREAHVDRILARRVRLVRGKEIEEWKVRWTGYSKAHDQWRTRDKLEHGGPLQQLREFESARISMEAQVREEAVRRREQRQRRGSSTGTTFAYLIADPCDELHLLEHLESEPLLPWEQREILEDGTLAHIAELCVSDLVQSPTPRILVLFSGTGSVEREFLGCFPSATVVTLDSAAVWQPTHVSDIRQWDYRQYSPGYFEHTIEGK
eukprot:gene11813-biopygen12132